MKKCQFLLYLDLVKIRLEIILSVFAEKKNICDLKKLTEFFKVQIIAFFPKGLIHAFDQKMPNSSLFSSAQILSK